MSQQNAKPLPRCSSARKVSLALSLADPDLTSNRHDWMERQKRSLDMAISFASPHAKLNIET